MNNQDESLQQDYPRTLPLPSGQGGKKSYTTPELKVHGSVKEITQLVLTKATDGTLGSVLL